MNRYLAVSAIIFLSACGSEPEPCPMDLCKNVVDPGPPERGDSKAPALVSLEFEPNVLNTDEGPASLTVSARITDNLSGFVEGDVVYVWSQTPDQMRFSSTEFARVSGDALEGDYKVTITLPHLAPRGEYKILYVRLSDLVGNSRKYFTAELAAAGMQTVFNQVGQLGDEAGPAVESLVVTPNSVNTDSAAAQVTVRAHMTDAMTGVLFSSVGYGLPSGASDEVPQTSALFFLVSGTPQDGIFEAHITLPRGSPRGTYPLAWLSLSDNAENFRVLLAPDLAAAGLAASFEQVGTLEDRAAPRVTSFTVETHADVDGAVTLKFNVGVADDLAGLLEGFVAVTPPNETDYNLQRVGPGLSEATRVSGDANSGMYVVEHTMPALAPGGVYQFSIMLRDGVSNNVLVNHAQLEAFGFASSFVLQ